MHSATVERIYREAFGHDNAGDAQPNAFYSLATLERLLAALRIEPGDVLADLGCGHGGSSMWAAERTRATVIGIDLSPAGVDLARRRAAENGLGERTRFEVGDVTETGLPPDSCDAAMSLDVLPFVSDKDAAFREAARILRRGGRCAFTTWEGRRDWHGAPHPLAAVQDAPPITDHRPLLERAGLEVEMHEEPPGWEAQQRALAEGILAAEHVVRSEMGAHYPAMARSMLANLPGLRYVLIVARAT
jgi:SAM-dependent methyltransferase